MQTLNLIDQSKGSIGYRMIDFPDGEPHIVLDDIDRKNVVNVICRIANPNDLFIVMQVGDILNRQGVLFSLTITYLMSMRMDRVISFNESFSLKVVANMINSIHAIVVDILEPHSTMSLDLIENSRCNSFNITLISEDVICFPDKGAAKRYERDIIHPSFKKTILYCSKERDISTGKLKGFKIENPEAYHGGSICVVDDLCDGGGTFAGIAKELRQLAPDVELNIRVMHMVNPKGISTLSEHYDKVTFSNSFYDWNKLENLPDNVTCRDLLTNEENN